MKYMVLMQTTQANLETFASLPAADIERHIGFMKRLNRDLVASGELVDAQGLAMPVEAKIVQARPGGGPPVVTDGPFAESKEFLAGYWIVDVENLDRAIALAAHISTAPGRGGAPLNFPVEIRQVMSEPPSPAEEL